MWPFARKKAATQGGGITQPTEVHKVSAIETQEFQKFTPAGFDAPPTTVLEALRQAKAVLTEERWVKNVWFANKHPEVDPEDAFCNSWQTCAMGAVGIVTIGNSRQVYTYPERSYQGVKTAGPSVSKMQWGFNRWCFQTKEDHELYNKTVAALQEALPDKVREVEVWDEDSQRYKFVERTCQYDVVHEFNDDPKTTYADLEAAFDKAIAAQEALVDA